MKANDLMQLMEYIRHLNDHELAVTLHRELYTIHEMLDDVLLQLARIQNTLPPTESNNSDELPFD